MYAWIWRRLPFGLPGKLAGSVLIVTAVGALLWYVVFPWAEPLLPFTGTDVEVTQDSGVSGGGPGVDGSDTAGDGNDLPYSTESNDPEPSATRTR